jgi:hypothetical protein
MSAFDLLFWTVAALEVVLVCLLLIGAAMIANVLVAWRTSSRRHQ